MSCQDKQPFIHRMPAHHGVARQGWGWTVPMLVLFTACQPVGMPVYLPPPEPKVTILSPAPEGRPSRTAQHTPHRAHHAPHRLAHQTTPSVSSNTQEATAHTAPPRAEDEPARATQAMQQMLPPSSGSVIAIDAHPHPGLVCGHITQGQDAAKPFFVEFTPQGQISRRHIRNAGKPDDASTFQQRLDCLMLK